MPNKIKVMISSRCNDPVQLDGKSKIFTDLRKRIKQEVEKARLFSQELFEVWINEDAPPEEGSTDSWDICLQQIDEADIVIVLFNGNPGWAKESGDIGICHAELERALSTAPAKVRLIQLPMCSLKIEAEKARSERFTQYIQAQNLFRGAETLNGEQAIQRVLQALHDAVLDMASLARREYRKGKYYYGQALSWSHLDFSSRKEIMESTMRKYLLARSDVNEGSTKDSLLLQISDRKMLIVIHAIPGSMSIASAREMVGRPFYRDHNYARYLNGNIFGPIHFIGCHKKVTETQVLGLVGHPDVTVVNAPFGVYIIDTIQQIQLVFLADCRDPSSTEFALQRFFAWLEQSGETQRLVERAEKRARVVNAIAKEIRE